MSKSQEMRADVAALLRARNPLLWVVTREEQRVERYLFEAAADAGYLARFWDVAAGVTSLDGSTERSLDGADADAVFTAIGDRSGERNVWIMRDLPVWLTQQAGGLITLRKLRNLARELPGKGRDDAQAIIVISPTADVPAELSNHATVLEWSLPDREEIAALFDATVESLPNDMQAGAAETRDAAIDAAIGLSGEEAQATFAKSIVSKRRIDPAVISAEKQRIIAKSGVLEWVKPLKGGMDSVGGLENWKSWARSRALAYTPEAREYGLEAPKGALLVGVPGCGKSFSAKGLASEWQVPLLKLDMGALKGKYVGESEANIRKAFGTIEAIGRCVVWVDEIEKALAGSTGEAGDGGVSADALGALLNWMQERQGEAFVIATANNAEKLPPELMRKGRFDEVWWIDLPNEVERAAIITSALKVRGRDAKVLKVDLNAVAAATDTFTGAEIDALVPDAMFAAYADGAREITTADLINAASSVVPMAKQNAEKITELRARWSERARQASATPDVKAEKRSGGRQLDLV